MDARPVGFCYPAPVRNPYPRPGAPMLARPRSPIPPLTLFAVVLLGSTTPPARSAAAPAAKPAFSLEHAIAMKQVQGPTWSRDGRRIAFVVNAPDTAENTTNQDVWLWDAATNSCRALTRSPKNDYAPQFSPGGDTLAFLSARDSDEGKPSIWLLPLAGGG